MFIISVMQLHKNTHLMSQLVRLKQAVELQNYDTS